MKTTVQFFLLMMLTAPLQAQSGTSQDASNYLNGALNIMQWNVLGRDSVDWLSFRAAVYSRAGDAVTPGDTHAAIRWALSQLNPHSFLLTREMREQLASLNDEGDQSTPSTSRSPFSQRRSLDPRLITGGLHDAIGYLAVPQFAGPNPNEFADLIQAAIVELHRDGACGWVVDLRGNGGGNMWPMLAGLGALLGDGVVGGFAVQEGDRRRWRLADGAVGVESGGTWSEMASVSEAYAVDPHPPVAILIDGGTMSSGEAVAIAFVGRSETRSFGQATYGFATSNANFPLRDGATLVLTTSYQVDRRGQRYPDGVFPDEPIDLAVGDTVWTSRPDEANDNTLRAALEWLAARTTCNQVREAAPRSVSATHPRPQSRDLGASAQERLLVTNPSMNKQGSEISGSGWRTHFDATSKSVPASNTVTAIPRNFLNYHLASGDAR